MAQDKDQLVDEGAMEKMSVAPPDPEADRRQDGRSEGEGGQSLMSQLKDNPTEHRIDQDAATDAPQPGESGVADEDPLSAHPT